MTRRSIWVKCPECRHVWPVAHLPMGLGEAAHLMRAAFCPNCGNDSPEMAAAAEIPTAQQENDMSATTRPAGAYILNKADPAKPRRQHRTFEAARTEAGRLAALNPGSEFIISQEIARVVSEPDSFPEPT